jgi:hypothetical protein
MILGPDIFFWTLVSWNLYQGFVPFYSILDYECSFWRRLWIMSVRFGDGNVRSYKSFLHPTFNHHHKEVFILKVRFFTLYFVHVSCIQGCRELIVEKNCDSSSFSFKLFIEVLPLVIILDALMFCIETFMVSHCLFHVLKFSWFLVVLLGELKLCVEALGFLFILWVHSIFVSKL